MAPRLSAADLPDYKIGDTVKETIVTPIPLAVINPDETTALKKKEASREPFICGYYTNALDEALGQFDTAFATTRSNFLDGIQTVFERRQLDAATIATEDFHEFLASFQQRNKMMPISTNLAEIWARGESGQSVQDYLATILHSAMKRAIRPPNLPPDIQLGGAIRLVPLEDWETVLTREKAEKRGFVVSRSDIISFTHLQDDLLQAHPLRERPVIKFLTTLMKTNCVPDLELTVQARARRTEGMVAADHYEAGQAVATQGQVVDKKIKAALDQLRAMNAAENLEQTLRAGELNAKHMKRQLVWAGAGAALLVAALMFLLWRLARRNLTLSPVPARMAANSAPAAALPCPAGGETIVLPESASQLANRSALRDKVAPHLARFLADKLVRRLLSQRSALLSTQELAAAEMAELEARLEKIHAPLQERLRAYEERIRELEKELALRSRENRELIQLKIQLATSQVAAAKSKLEFN
jgi:hypothetical protein